MKKIQILSVLKMIVSIKLDKKIRNSVSWYTVFAGYKISRWEKEEEKIGQKKVKVYRNVDFWSHYWDRVKTVIKDQRWPIMIFSRGGLSSN